MKAVVITRVAMFGRETIGKMLNTYHERERSLYERLSDSILDFTWEFFAFIWPAVLFCWNIIVIFYEFVDATGVIGIIVTFVIGIVMGKSATWLIGQRGRPTIKYIPSFGIPRYDFGHPEIIGNATNWVGILGGAVLRILSVVFLGVAVAAVSKRAFLQIFPPA